MSFETPQTLLRETRTWTYGRASRTNEHSYDAAQIISFIIVTDRQLSDHFEVIPQK